ncbi:hypothetical protein C1752_00269 [Acaryochloris thomasi RCC1774]|uniref:DUF1902 domain-containing protein n=1 Tax=Acaryochloris thomasi RCC1774 TaxID=1764569 RepID=A0A2W1K7E6_9CYAN|nr:DUF1902 domain-containing protein [Acaryochloris thomasi]PZD75501.1 hypothetical protein C1752_00269 [Acaryochloris thomasi RCC1774]
MSQEIYKIGAFWDSDAQVWTATSEDVPGLATEADSQEALLHKLKTIVPELLQLNHLLPSDHTGAIKIELISHRQELIQLTV